MQKNAGKTRHARTAQTAQNACGEINCEKVGAAREKEKPGKHGRPREAAIAEKRRRLEERSGDQIADNAAVDVG